VQKFLIIKLPPQQDGILFWTEISDPLEEVSFQPAEIEEISKKLNKHQVIAIAPGNEVLLMEAKIPGRNKNRILQALPFALEEQLAADLQELHFAVGRSPEEGIIPTAIIAYKTLNFWIQELSQNKLDPEIIIPAPLVIPRNENWTIVREEQLALVRTGTYTGETLDLENLITMLQLTLARDESDGEETITEGKTITFYQFSPEEQEELETSLKDLPCTCHFIAGKRELTDSLLGAIRSPEKTINLLQGKFSRHAHWGKIWKKWKATTIIMVILFSALGSENVTTYFKLKQQEKDLAVKIEKLYKETFPEAKKIVNPKAQMEHQLSLLENIEKTDYGFLSIFAICSKELVKTPGFFLESLRYKDQKLDLDLRVRDLASLDNLKIKLEKVKGIKPKIKTASKTDDYIRARIQITSKD
jgi:general secretion pathway protein L